LKNSMGTLFDQKVRHYGTVEYSHLDDFIAVIVKLSKKHGISVAEVIAAKEVLENERNNNFQVNNGDAFDEQMAGFGELLQQLISAIENSQSDT